MTLTTVGSGEVHLSGYFEPNKDEMDDGMMFDPADEEEDDDEDYEEEAVPSSGKLDKNLK